MPMDLSGIEEAVAIAETRWPGYRFRIMGNEAHGPCPIYGCAEDDGFVIYADGGYWCRPGDHSGWLDDDRQLSKEELRLRKIEAEQRRAAREREEMRQRISVLEWMSRCNDHLEYHNFMDSEDRAYWRNEGFFDATIDDLKLGFCVSCPTDKEHRPSYTLPIYRHDGRTLWNIVHRILSIDGTPLQSDKYRPHAAGLGKQLARAHILNGTPQAILVEGAKKAEVIAQYGFPTLGLQGCRGRFKGEWVHWMKHLRKLWIAFDPDATTHAYRLGQGLAKAIPRCEVRVCVMPGKPDDLFVRYNADPADFRHMLDMGVRA